MVTELLLPQLAFRALSDDPEGDEDEVDTGLDKDLEEKDGDIESEEELGNAGFGVEESNDEGTE